MCVRGLGDQFFLYVCVLGFVVRVMEGEFYVGVDGVLCVLGSILGYWGLFWSFYFGRG